MRKLFVLLSCVFLATQLLAMTPEDSLQVKIDKIEKSLVYQHGVIEFPSCHAKLTVPKGFRFLDAKQSQYVICDLWGNPADSSILGLLVPESRGVLDPKGWAFTIGFDEIGFVRDDNAADINYDELLDQMKQELKDGNADREKAGYEPIELVGWASKPFYDSQIKVLHWAKEAKFGTSTENTLNYNLRILGKDGVFVLNAVAPMSELNEVKPTINGILTSVQFDKGSSYFDFDPKVDKVAAWTIGGLVAGKVLAKVGILAFLAKFAKVIVIGVAAAGTGIWKFITGRKDGKQSKTEEVFAVAEANKPEEEEKKKEDAKSEEVDA